MENGKTALIMAGLGILLAVVLMAVAGYIASKPAKDCGGDTGTVCGEVQGPRGPKGERGPAGDPGEAFDLVEDTFTGNSKITGLVPSPVFIQSGNGVATATATFTVVPSLPTLGSLEQIGTLTFPLRTSDGAVGQALFPCFQGLNELVGLLHIKGDKVYVGNGDATEVAMPANSQFQVSSFVPVYPL